MQIIFLFCVSRISLLGVAHDIHTAILNSDTTNSPTSNFSRNTPTNFLLNHMKNLIIVIIHTYTHTHTYTHIYIYLDVSFHYQHFVNSFFYFLFLLLSFFVLNYLNIPSKLVWYLFPNSTLLKGTNNFSHLNRQITTLHI